MAGLGQCPAAARTLQWTPSRAQTGLAVLLCFNATAAEAAIERCFAVSVAKCRYCAQAGESLSAIATGYGTDWLQLWGANPHLSNPHRLALMELINLGSLYPARLGDTLASLAARFLVDITTMQVWTPPLPLAFTPEPPQAT